MAKSKFQPKSSFMQNVEYSEDDRTMDITFNNGSQHRYLFVFKPTFEAFQSAPDHGVFYAHLIKNKFRSMPIISKNIGHNKSNPLHAIKQRRTLSNGKAITGSHGTVSRALNRQQNRTPKHSKRS